MRGTSPGHYRPTADEYRAGWDEGVIAVDASVLLSLYRYSATTRDELLSLLQTFGDRLWLPHQSAIEYERNRIGVIRQQLAAYDTTLATLSKSLDAVRTEFSKLARHPLLDQEALGHATDKYEAEVTQLIEETRKRHPTAGTSADEFLADPTRVALESLFQGQVGAAYDDDQSKSVLDEAVRRADTERPPGYLDKDKPEPARYGDFFFWRQSLDRAVEKGAPLVILTDDEKEDWWWRAGGLTLGPRPELVEEFFAASGGRRLLMYTTERFISEANRQAGVEQPVSEEAVGEVKRLAAEREVQLVSRTAECPACGAAVTFLIGAERGHTALPRCVSCDTSFHAFHLDDGGVGTRLPGPAFRRPRSIVHCPSCAAEFSVTTPLPGQTKLRTCLRCGALLVIGHAGAAMQAGQAQELTVAGDETRCPQCETNLRFGYRTERDERASCPTCSSLVVRPLEEHGA